MIGRIRYGEGNMRIVGVYVKEDLERKLEEMEKMDEGMGGKSENDNWGDFNQGGKEAD